jgi:hypothetical protein
MTLEALWYELGTIRSNPRNRPFYRIDNEGDEIQRKDPTTQTGPNIFGRPNFVSFPNLLNLFSFPAFLR